MDVEAAVFSGSALHDDGVEVFTFSGPQNGYTYYLFQTLMGRFMTYNRCRLVWLPALCALTSSLAAGTYYVDPDGNDDNPGTRQAPWRSVTHAAEHARAGDTVVFFPGDYEDSLVPANSGSEERPIVFRSAERRRARLIGDDPGDMMEGGGTRIALKEVSHIQIIGFDIVDTATDRSTGGWLTAINASHITIEDCRFTGGYRWAHFRVLDCDHFAIRDNHFSRRRHSGDMVLIRGTSHLIIEGNSFNRALHTMVGVNEGRNVVVRGNVFHSGWSRNFSSRANDRVLVENNVFTNGYNGSWSGGTGNRFVGNRHIVRYNRFFRNSIIPGSSAAASSLDTMHNRIHNNLFHGNGTYGWVSVSNRSNFRDQVMKNNIFASNDPHGSRTQLGLYGGGSESVKLMGNNFYAGASDHPALFWYGREPLGLSEAQQTRGQLQAEMQGVTVTREEGRGKTVPVEAVFHFMMTEDSEPERDDVIFVGTPENHARLIEVDAENRRLVVERELDWRAGDPVGFYLSPDHLDVFRNNHELDPRFVDPDNFDFALAHESELRDLGVWLTTTRKGGGGRELPVYDPYSFFDGFGIIGETGDLIAVGRPGNLARVESVDYERKVLRLDREIAWDAEAPVCFPWSGDVPAMGVYQYGPNTAPSVRVTVSDGIVSEGRPVGIIAHVQGLAEPLEYRWHLGDGTLSTEESITHLYDGAGDYGIRLRVADANGTVVRGVGYVVVESGEKDPDVLIHTTFDADDNDWWKHWQFYRGRRGAGYANYDHILDESTGRGYHHISARDGGGPLPAYFHPRGWNIDRYPRVRLRYRIRPDTPIAIFVRPFPSAYHIQDDMTATEDPRRYYFAGTASEPRGEQTLIDDGEWHEISFDVRDIRNRYPKVDVLHTINIGDLEIDGGTPVPANGEFWLDEIYIGK